MVSANELFTRPFGGEALSLEWTPLFDVPLGKMFLAEDWLLFLGLFATRLGCLDERFS